MPTARALNSTQSPMEAIMNPERLFFVSKQVALFRTCLWSHCSAGCYPRCTPREGRDIEA